MKPLYEDNHKKIYNGDCLDILPQLDSESIDLLVTDPPYGIGFMGKDWDRALPDKRIWAECLRVLKSGSFAFVMSIPRQDCLARMIINLQDVGFEVGFTPIYWAYASGFPKAQNIGKVVDKRLGVHNPKLVPTKQGNQKYDRGTTYATDTHTGFRDVSSANSPQAKALDGSYGGFQPKPAVEVIIVAMKPLSEKTFVDQALKNRKGITWLDDGRIPVVGNDRKGIDGGGIYNDSEKGASNVYGIYKSRKAIDYNQGRFPANLLCSDDVLNDGRVTKSGYMEGKHIAPNTYGGFNTPTETQTYPDSGSFSRYFDLDKWAQKTFPFLVVPKASKGEKNRGLDMKKDTIANPFYTNLPDLRMKELQNRIPSKNNHPTVKPLKLMSYLITLGSREGDTVLDPFLGSGTTALACQLLNRECIGIELEEKYCEIARHRCSQQVMEV